MKCYYLFCKLFKVIILPLVLLITLSVSLLPQTWTKVEGTNAYVNKIFFPPDNPSKVAVASSSIQTDILAPSLQLTNYGYQQLNGYALSLDSGKTFSSFKLTTYSVYDLFALPTNPSIWLASVLDSTLASGVVISTNNGDTWDTTKLYCPNNGQIMKFAGVKTNPATLYGAAVKVDEGFKVTQDTFKTCTSNDSLDIYARDIAVSPLDSSLIFIAGDGVLYGGVHHSYNKGKTWINDSQGLHNLRILCIMPSWYNKAVVFCGADSVDQYQVVHGKGIYQSLDTGRTWRLIGAQGHSVSALAQHPKYGKFLAAAGDSSGVWFSGSWGWGWENYSSGLPANSSVRTVAIPAWDSTAQGFIVFAGLFGQGLYRSTYVRTDVPHDNNLTAELIGVYPNPFNDKLTIVWFNTTDQKVRIRLINMLGEEISNIADDYYPAGEQLVNWTDGQQFAPGVYNLIIEAGKQVISSKVVKY